MNKLFYFKNRINSALVEKISVFSLFILVFYCFSLESRAQVSTEQVVVGIAPFTSSENCCTDKSYVGMIQECVITAIQDAKRFKLVERAQMNSIFNEEVLNKGESFMNETALEQGKKIGAKFLLLGSVASAKADSIGKKAYKGDILFSLRLVNVETAEILEAVTIKPQSTSGSLMEGASKILNPNKLLGNKEDGAVDLNNALTASTPIEAFNAVLKNVDNQIRKNFIGKIPIAYKIVEVSEKESNGSPKTILINAGSNKGINVKDKFKVIEVTPKVFEVVTKYLKKDICSLTVTEVQGEDFSVCEVEKKNAVLLRDLMKNTDAKIYVVPEAK
jgi:curli biogenesis system outer membrane secretion channel CsgG